MAVLRFIACAIIFTGGLMLLIGNNRDAYDLMLFPIIGLVPAALYTALVLRPIERSAVARGGGAHLVWLLPLAGAAFPFATMIVLALFWGEPSAIPRIAQLGVMAALPAGMGLMWGTLWWLTGLPARLMRPGARATPPAI